MRICDRFKAYSVPIICGLLWMLVLNCCTQSKGISCGVAWSPLPIGELDGEYYYVNPWICGLRSDSTTQRAFEVKDYSTWYETYLTGVPGIKRIDVTKQLKNGSIYMSPFFFSSDYSEGLADSPITGVLGDDFRLFQVYIYSNVKVINPLQYEVKGKTKTGGTVRDFAGEIKIKKVFYQYDREFDLDSYRIIASYRFKEDPTQYGSGEYAGIFGADGYTVKDGREIKVDDLMIDADGYANRNYVGIRTSYSDKNKIERCVWGDNRLPFTLDFDVGASEMCPNEKYRSPEWEAWRSGEVWETYYDSDGESHYRYKTPWW